MMETGFLLLLLLVFAAGQASPAVITGKPEQIKYGSVFAELMNAYTGMMSVTMLREEEDLWYQDKMIDFI